MVCVKVKVDYSVWNISMRILTIKTKNMSEKENGGNNSPKKGSAENPYTQEEYEEMCDAGTWNGGYVSGMGYVLPEVVVTGSSSSEEEWSFPSIDDSWSDPWAQDYPENNGNSGESGGESGNSSSSGGAGGTGSGGSGGSNTSTSDNSGSSTPSNNDEGAEDENAILEKYSYEEAKVMMDAGTWKGGYVQGYGYVLPMVTVIASNNPEGFSGEDILARAYAFKGTPYKSGGNNASGIDCSGLVTAALGLDQRWTTKSDISGMEKITISNLQNKLSLLQPGDILVWRWTDKNGYHGHAVIYVGGEQIFHAHSSGTNTTSDLLRYWNKKGVTTVYRKKN